MSIGKRIRELREKRGMMQKFVAIQAEIPQDELCKIENGKRIVKADVIPKIAAVLQIPKEQYYIFFE